MTSEEYANKYLENELKIIENSERKIVLPELTIFEKAIIYKYSDDGYQDLNENLRINNGANMPIYGKLLSECLDKLPNFVRNVWGQVEQQSEPSVYVHVSTGNAARTRAARRRCSA